MLLTIETISTIEKKSGLGICHLQRFWEKIQLKKNGVVAQDAFATEWKIDVSMLAALELGLEQTLSFIYKTDEGFDAFQHWILSANNNLLSEDKIKSFNDYVLQKSTTIVGEVEELTLSTTDLAFYETNGYVVIKNAVSKDDCVATVNAICEHLEIDLNNPETWYKQHPSKQGIMVQLFQHASIQKNRANLKIKTAFTQLWMRNDIFVNIDKVGFNPPETANWKFPGSSLHWDVSLQTPIPFGLQGVLYLSDTAADQGAFTVVPGFHHKLEPWLQNLPIGAKPRTQDLRQLNPIPIAAEAGDFIIWHHALPHCASSNTATTPRFVQYMTYAPLNVEVQMEWI